MRTTPPLLLLLIAAGCPEIIEGTASTHSPADSETSSDTSSATMSTSPSTSDPTTTTNATTTNATTSTNPTSTNPSTTNPSTTTDPSTTTVGCEGPCVPGEAPEGLSCTDDCAYDFSAVPQWLCSSGDCTPIGEDVGGGSCDQPDADLFCQLLTGNPNATADVFWEPNPVLDAPGFCCLSMTPELSLGPLPEYGIDNLCYMPTSMADEFAPNTPVLLATDVKCIEP